MKKYNIFKNDPHNSPDKNIWHGQILKICNLVSTRTTSRSENCQDNVSHCVMKSFRNVIYVLKMIHVVGRSVKGPDELLVRKSSERGSWESSAGDNFVAHHLEAVEDRDGVGGELHPPVLLVPHVGARAALLPQDPELGQWQPVHQAAARHERLSDKSCQRLFKC